MPSLRRLAALGSLALAAACVRSAPPATPDPRDGIEPAEAEVAPAEPVLIYFVNSSTVGAEVFAGANVRDERRLGTVQPGGTGRFVLPRETVRLGNTVVFVRLQPGTRVLQTGPVTVGGGDVFTVSLTLGANSLAVSPGRP